MEQFRMFIAITLSLVVFLAWNYFFSDAPEKQPVRDAGVLQEAVKRPPPASIDDKPKALLPNTMAPPATKNAVAAKLVTIEGPYYSVKIDSRGAVVKNILLVDYRETVDENSPYKELISNDNITGTLQTQFKGNSIPGLSGGVYSVGDDKDYVKISDQPETIRFTWVSEQGVIVEKRFTFYPDTYLIDLNITIANQSSLTIQDRFSLSLKNSVPAEKKAYGFEGPSALINEKLEQIDTDSLEDKNRYSGKIGWLALQDRYFMTSVIPKQTEDTDIRLDMSEDNLLTMTWAAPGTIIGPQEKKSFSFNVYFGPKKISVLKTVGKDLERAVDFGWFDFIARPCLWFMNFIYKVIPNYGLAIIILTILIKIILWPLGQKSYKSMNQMKRMQPLMAEIREKYKNDKRRINEEVMGLYKTYKVNPMGGCLPMVAQIPVFFAFYRMLYEAIELRHAPFMGWINDLSAPDRLFEFGFSVPFMEPPYGIPVLTIIMGATMFIQQKMQPPMGDPTQAKMMMFMPIIFTVIFINFSSGLVLYWLVNNILSIAQQYAIGKKNA